MSNRVWYLIGGATLFWGINIGVLNFLCFLAIIGATIAGLVVEDPMDDGDEDG